MSNTIEEQAILLSLDSRWAALDELLEGMSKTELKILRVAALNLSDAIYESAYKRHIDVF